MSTDYNTDDVIELTGDDGTVTRFVFLDGVVYNEREYVFLVPEEEIDGDQMYIFEVKEDDDGIFLEALTDEELLNQVYAEYEALVDQEDEEDEQ